MKQLLRRSILLCLILLFLPVIGEAETDYSLRLKTKDFVPQKMSNTAALSESLTGRHVLIQFDGPLDQATRSQLSAEGIEILDYIPNFAYSAKINHPIDQTLADSYDIRWIDAIEPALKIEPLLSRNGIGDWARRGDGRAQFAVSLHRDEDAQTLAIQFEDDLDAEIIGIEPSANTVDLIIPEAAYYRLAEFDGVIWIKQANQPPKALMDKARANTGTETLHAAPYSLTGAGTAVGVWDVGLVDNLHPDLMGRIITPDGGSVAFHPTHVTGIVIGSGYESDNQYRGMAPQGTVVSYNAWSTTSEMSSEYSLTQAMYGAKTSNNSWGHGYSASPEECDEIMGAYTSECTSLDNIVRGASTLPWVICWSAGNERGSSPDNCGGHGFVYRTIIRLASAKNVLTVGALDPVTDAMLYFSSWGPCKDGRIKPDVTAPGCMTSCANGGGYAVACGTSMASPAVAGIVSLLHQQAAASFPYTYTQMRSAAFRGLIINGAKDLGRVGPDYEFGHGRVDALNSVRKLITGDSSFVENWLATVGDEHTYDLTVPSNTEELRVTLVWDDWGAFTLTDIALVNDLDLIVIDPFGQEYHPWVLDPENPSQSATTGEDHLNVIETVSIMEPYPGLYTARVRGYNLPGGLQNYAIVFTPNAIHRPGNQRALAVFDSDDVEIDPGQSTLAEFWVTNVGTLTDSVTVHIEDDQGWISGVIDDELTLGQYDSAYYSVTATIPAEAMAWDKSWISCTTVSKTDGAISSTSQVAVDASANYSLALTIPESDTVVSPQVVPIAVTVENTGNDYDRVSVVLSSELEWALYPVALAANLAPGTDTTFDFTITVLAEEDHLANNLITIDVTSDGGITEQPSLTLTVYNPYQPPQ
ncbi:MAG: S8 family serine peptidase, partial [candidate division Zixibacteria bacterium]|nr:S8 family serine peptidase [candidate division Zixibacteria bacterium]